MTDVSGWSFLIGMLTGICVAWLAWQVWAAPAESDDE